MFSLISKFYIYFFFTFIYFCFGEQKLLNHLSLTAVGSNVVCNFEIWHARKSISMLVLEQSFAQGDRSYQKKYYTSHHSSLVSHYIWLGQFRRDRTKHIVCILYDKKTWVDVSFLRNFVLLTLKIKSVWAKCKLFSHTIIKEFNNHLICF